MRARYFSNVPWVGTEIVSDISLLASGTTDIGSLSASCDKTNTTIINNTVPANWTLLDIVGDIYNTRVLSKVTVDGLRTKYVIMRFDAGNAGFNFATCSTWSSGTHTGTDTTSYEAHHEETNTTVPIIFEIFITPAHFTTISYLGGRWRFSSLVEINRSLTCPDVYAPGNNYPNWGYLIEGIENLSGSYPYREPRVPVGWYISGSVPYFGSNALGFSVATLNTGSTSGQITTRNTDESVGRVAYSPLHLGSFSSSIGYRGVAYGNILVAVSRPLGITFGDTIIIDGFTYYYYSGYYIREE